MAYFIVPEESAALKVTEQAFTELDRTYVEQKKRSYYKADDRYKMSLSRHQLLQRLVFEHTEPYEIAQEQQAPHTLDEATLFVRYIKHLVRFSLRQNTFFMTVGLGRLLYTYSTSDVVKVYGFLTNHEKDVMQFRRAKGKILESLIARFGNLIEVTTVNQENRITSHPNPPSALIDLALDSLRQFTPWGSREFTEDDFRKLAEHGLLSQIVASPSDPTPELTLTLAQLNLVINPDSFSRLAEILRLKSPATSIGVPRFMIPPNSHQPLAGGSPPLSGSPSMPPGGNRLAPPKLTTDEINESFRRIDRSLEQARDCLVETVVVCLDGKEAARINVTQESRVVLPSIPECTESISLWAVQGPRKILLAKYYFSEDWENPNPKTTQTTFELENGLS
ncbi:MAG TPA: hypothetical protein PLB18_17455, partial [Acidobacteriota bacterium]|nr:hypothetical protein [Acidobacteriota bacterium]